MRPKPDSELNEMAESSNTAAMPSDAGDLRMRKRYDGAFKLQAVLKLLRGEKQTQVGHELGVSQPLLSIWKRKTLSAIYRELGVNSEEQARLREERPARRLR